MHESMGWMDGWSSVLRPRQHSIGYMGDRFTGQKTQPTVSKYWRNNLEIGDGDVLYGDGVGMGKKSWGSGGNGADFQYCVTL